MTKDELTGKDGLLRQLTSRFYERVLNAEMDQYLGYKKHHNAGDHCGNSRNGYSEKTVILDDNSTTSVGASTIGKSRKFKNIHGRIFLNVTPALYLCLSRYPVALFSKRSIL